MGQIDKVAIVTGASKGIGRAIACILADEGYDVVCTARSEAKLEETAALVRAKGRKALAVRADVSSSDDVSRMVDAAMGEFGRIDVLINNAGGPLAGVMSPAPKTQDEFFTIMDNFTFFNIGDKDWQAIFNSNFYGVYNCTRAVLPLMLKQDSGHIINITSKSGKMKSDVLPGMIAYASAKAAVSRFTEVLAFELMCAGSPVRVNAVSPGMVAVSFHENLSPEERAGFLEPEEIRGIILKLLDESDPVCGEVFTSETMKTWYQEIQETGH